MLIFLKNNVAENIRQLPGKARMTESMKSRYEFIRILYSDLDDATVRGKLLGVLIRS